VKTRQAIDDRRAANRFPIERQIYYKTIGKRKIGEDGLGQTINISSTGVLFTTDQRLSPGRRLEVSISWPAQLDSSVGLQLVAKGRIVRCEHGTAAIEIQRYEFRTCANGNPLNGAQRLAAGTEEQQPASSAIA
jgi:hypothetical protein